MGLVFDFVVFAAFGGSVAFSGSVATSRSVASSGVQSRGGILSNFFNGNNLFLQLLITLSLGLYNNPKLFEKEFFSSAFLPTSKFFNSLAKLLCLLSSSIH